MSKHAIVMNPERIAHDMVWADIRPQGKHRLEPRHAGQIAESHWEDCVNAALRGVHQLPGTGRRIA